MNTLLQGLVCLFAIWISKYCATHIARSMPRVERQGWTNNHWSMADSHNTVRVSISLVKEMGVSKDGSSNIAGGVAWMNGQRSRGNSNNTMGFSIPLLPSCNQSNWSASVACGLYSGPDRRRPLVGRDGHCSQHMWVGSWPG